MMKRALLGIGITLFALALVLGILILSVNLLVGGWAIDVTKGKTLVDLFNILASLSPIIAAICVIVMAIVVINRYIHYRHPYKFVFEGFSNATELIQAESKPVDINSLAQEELERQFRIISNRLKKYIEESSPEENRNVQSPLKRKKYATNISVFLAEDGDSEEDSRLSKIGWYIPTEDMIPPKTIESMVYILKDTMRSFEDSGLSNLITTSDDSDVSKLMTSFEDSAPKIAPIIRLIDTLFPVPVIKVICHLQWRNDRSDEVGITFEFIDFSKSRQQVLKNQTLWWKKPSSDYIQQSTKLVLVTGNSTHVERTLTENYIELLQPAMRWLVLLSWEYYMRKKYTRSPKDSEIRLSALFWLFGTLYYASADHYPICSDFFHHYAIHCLCRAEENKFPGLSLPYLYLADRTVSKAKKASGPHRYYMLLREALNWYKEALAYATGEKKTELTYIIKERKAPHIIQNWIKSRKAVVIFHLPDEQLIRDTEGEIDKLKLSDEIGNFIRYDSLEDIMYFSLYFFDLGSCYATRAESTSVKDPKQLKKNASDYLIYSFVLDSYRWDKKDIDKDFARSFKALEEFQDDIFAADTGLTYLRKTLKSKLIKLPEPTNNQFQTEVNKIISDWEKQVRPTWFK